MHEHLGDRLVDFAHETHSSAFLAAPFVRSVALERILSALGPDVTLTLITRWSPEEIVAGASDLGVWDLVRGRRGAKLRLLPGLHAKYFRFDRRVLLGSANLTNMALGWSSNPNLELLVEHRAEDFASFEALTLSRSFEVDDAARDAMQSAVDALRGSTPPRTPAEIETAEEDTWFPRSLQVQRIFDCYEGRGDQVIASVFRDGQIDLLKLNPPLGLDEGSFNGFVAARMQELPVVAIIDAAAVRATDRSAGAQLLVDAGVTSAEDAVESWDVISAWLAHFFPDRYRVKATYTGPALERSQALR